MPGNKDDIHSEIILKVSQDTAECEGWTWNDETNADFKNLCVMFSDLGMTTSYPGCVREESIEILFARD